MKGQNTIVLPESQHNNRFMYINVWISDWQSDFLVALFTFQQPSFYELRIIKVWNLTIASFNYFVTKCCVPTSNIIKSKQTLNICCLLRVRAFGEIKILRG